MSQDTQTDPLREAIDTIDLPALVAHYYPDSGAAPGKRGAVFAVWRGDRHKSFSLFISRSGSWLWRDHGTGESGNSYRFLTDIAGFSRAEAAAMLVERHHSPSPNLAGNPSHTAPRPRPEGLPPIEDALWRALNQNCLRAFVHPLSKMELSQEASIVCVREALSQPHSKEAKRIIEAAFQALKAVGRQRSQHGKIKEVYDYLDERENLLFQVLRFEPKSFAQRRKAPDGKWIWGLAAGGYRKNGSGNWVQADPGEKVGATFGDTPLALYHLPQLKSGIARQQPVFIVEGEKDVHTLEQLGFVATTNPGGAFKWHEAEDSWNAGYSNALRDANVIIVPDHDEAGFEHAKRVGRALKGIARSWLILALPNQKPKCDVSDWIAAGHTRDELLMLVREAR